MMRVMLHLDRLRNPLSLALCSLALFALVFVLGSAAASAAPIDLVVNTAQSSVGATLVVTVFGDGDSDTVTDVPFTGTVQAGVGLGDDVTFGVVPTALRFVSGQVSSTGTSFDLQVMPGVTIDINVLLDDISGGFDDVALAAEPPIAPNTARVDLAPIALVFDSGALEVTTTPPGDTTPLDLAVTPLVFALGAEATVVTQSRPGWVDVTVTLPIDETASVSESGVDVDLTLFGDLVLEGTIPVQAPGLSTAGVIATAVLLVIAAVWLQRRSLALSR
jgi:hypothetical protein